MGVFGRWSLPPAGATDLTMLGKTLLNLDLVGRTLSPVSPTICQAERRAHLHEQRSRASLLETVWLMLEPRIP